MTKITTYAKLAYLSTVNFLRAPFLSQQNEAFEKPSTPGKIKPWAFGGIGRINEVAADTYSPEVTLMHRLPMDTFAEAMRSGKGEIAECKLMMVKQSKVNGKVATLGKESYTISEVSAAALSKCKEALKKRESWDGFGVGDYGGAGSGFYDANQYHEYIPIMGGPFYRQMYMYDMLAAHQKSFEAYNHNPIARRIVSILRQYTLGRGYKVQGDPDKVAIWEAFDKRFNIKKNLRKRWFNNFVIFGEHFMDRSTMRSIDPSTIWDIITNPDDIDDVYYYYQNYPTAYQQFTGHKVPGVPGSEKQPSMQYIIRQLPYDRVLHIRSSGNTAEEKRGRPMLYPVLSWLKRFNDYWNAEVAKSWVQACYTFDDTVKGSLSDVQSHASAFKSIPRPLSNFTHNESVERKFIGPTGNGGGRLYLSSELLAIISATLGIPMQFLNAAMEGGGSRAGALMGSEPFTKVIDELQLDMEDLLQELAKIAFELEGQEYDGSLEFIFPSIVKDTTSEAVKNIQAGEVGKYISHRRASTMYAAEMNITTYNAEDEAEDIAEEVEAGLQNTADTLPTGYESPDATGGEEDNPIHGQGKKDMEDSLNNI